MAFFDKFRKKKLDQEEELLSAENTETTAEADTGAAEPSVEAVNASTEAADTENANINIIEEKISENTETALENTEKETASETLAKDDGQSQEQFGSSVIDEYGEESSQNENPERKIGFFGRLKKGLQKTRADFNGKMASVFAFGRKIDDDFYDELEEILIQSDVGVRTAMDLTDRLRERQKAEKIKDTTVLQEVLESEIENILLAGDERENKIYVEDGKLNVILVVGVNGAGKTTTIGKMAHYYRICGKKVLLAAADTFRAAAIEQLCEWGKRVNVPVIRQNDGSDPGAVVFDACQAAKSRRTDVLIVDTAGRLQNKKNLMEELRKIHKIINREAPDSNIECLLVLDAGTGQNAISQAQLFGEVVDLTGIILTKLDGTAKGGVVIGITNELNLPVKMIGVGEGIDDLREFVPADFVRALFETDNSKAANYEPVPESDSEK